MSDATTQGTVTVFTERETYEEREKVQVEYATESELLAFANKVRQAGGANPIPALLPAYPSDPNRCLIALALNFECEVDSAYVLGTYEDKTRRWGMRTTHEIAGKLAEAEGFETIPVDSTSDNAGCYVVLPQRIAACAVAFDKGEAFQDYEAHDEDGEYDDYDPYL
jgi:hypothetical protein